MSDVATETENEHDPWMEWMEGIIEECLMRVLKRWSEEKLK